MYMYMYMVVYVHWCMYIGVYGRYNCVHTIYTHYSMVDIPIYIPYKHTRHIYTHH
jgi:hypothetical protein